MPEQSRLVCIEPLVSCWSAAAIPVLELDICHVDDEPATKDERQCHRCPPRQCERITASYLCPPRDGVFVLQLMFV